MSTRSNIAIKRKDGTIDSIYCHYDGYYSHNGKILYDFYQDEDKINKLITLGDISTLDRKIDPNPNVIHGFDYNERQNGVVVAYGRDRGEKGTEFRKYKNMEEYKNHFSDSWEEFAYLYDTENKEWLCSEIPFRDEYEITFSSLENALKSNNLINSNESKIDSLSWELVDYCKDWDFYSFKDCFDNDEEAFNSIKGQLFSKEQIKMVIKYIKENLEELQDEDLNNPIVKEKYDATTNILNQLNVYNDMFEKNQLDEQKEI